MKATFTTTGVHIEAEDIGEAMALRHIKDTRGEVELLIDTSIMSRPQPAKKRDDWPPPCPAPGVKAPTAMKNRGGCQYNDD